jgi:methylisocitrate lyase
LRSRLGSGAVLRFPGAFNPLAAMLIEQLGFDGVYVSGAAVSAGLGLPDIGLVSSSELVLQARQVARVTALPVLVDADTGFGEPMNVARTVQELEDAGATGCHIEDQVMPKRCGHLDGKSVVEQEEMVRRVRAAVTGRRDPGFVVCARTDARAVEGLGAAIERARAYVDAGADMIFPEALEDESEIAAFRAAVDVPLLVNMTEFGKTPLLGVGALASLGVDLVIYPVTLLRLAMGAVEDGLRRIRLDGDQTALVGSMLTRVRLYEILDYAGYNVFDAELFDARALGSGQTDAGAQASEQVRGQGGAGDGG